MPEPRWFRPTPRSSPRPTRFRKRSNGHSSAKPSRELITIHGYIGGDIGGQHGAFEDPFVFLLHSNVDRLFAMWQAEAGESWRLDESQVYGDQSNTNDSEGILQTFQPWDGTVEFGARSSPGSGRLHKSRSRTAATFRSSHRRVMTPFRLPSEQVAPVAPDPIEFVGVVEHLPTARALRLKSPAARRSPPTPVSRRPSRCFRRRSHRRTRTGSRNMT